MKVKETKQSGDLAAALRGDQGTFICQQGGQNFLVTAAEGHSIKNGPTPIGPRVEQAANDGQWTITKLTDEVLDFPRA